METYVYPKTIEEAAKKYKKHAVKNKDEETMLKKLSKKRFDVALTDPKLALYICQAKGHR